MRQAGTLPPDADAERFADYLLTLGIKTRIDDGADGRIVWIKDEKDLERGRSELAAYVANAADPKYKLAEDGARTIRKELEAREEQYRKNLMDVRRRWSQPISGRAPVTLALISISVMLAIVSMFSGESLGVTDYLYISSVRNFLAELAATGLPPRGAEILPEIRHGQLWRLITPIFLHAGVIHILFNMLMLQNMGTLVETREGSGRMLALVLVSAVISNLGQYFFGDLFLLSFWKNPDFSGIVFNPFFSGMSGVNYALFGYLWLRSRGGSAGFMLHPNTVFLMLGWLVLCMTGAMGSVANGAHAVGLVVGMAAGYLANRA